MSSLWTPGGEHKVPRPGEGDRGPGAGAPPGTPPGSPPGNPPGRPPRPADLTEEDLAAGATEEELRELARQLAETPVEDIVANHCYGLFELAALHLSQKPVNLPAARFAIDSMGYLVDGLGDRLGQHTGALADGLTQLRLAFVRIAEAASAAASAGEGAAGNGAPAAPADSAPADASAPDASPSDSAAGDSPSDGGDGATGGVNPGE